MRELHKAIRGLRFCDSGFIVGRSKCGRQIEAETLGVDTRSFAGLYIAKRQRAYPCSIAMKPKRKKTHQQVLIEEVHAIYRELANRPIERSCKMRTECCQFRLTGKVPFLTKGEAMVAARAWRATGRKLLPVAQDSKGSCPMLDVETGRCRIYENRPFSCRTHFCSAAGGPYKRADVIDLIRRLEEVDRQLGGEGFARQLETAVSGELGLDR
jgi:uncharacterized protein